MMDKLIIRGQRGLSGTVKISGAKNATLPLMCASLLTGDALTLTGAPELADAATMAELLRILGVKVTRAAGTGSQTITLQAGRIEDVLAPYEVVRKMRASVLVLGPLAARCGVGKISLPGGCAIGDRPVDLHLAGLERMGAKITLKEGYIEARAAKGGLKGAAISFPFVSVGATLNLMMAAALAKGKTTLRNAAREPEIADLARCLSAMGAKISGAGTRTITIEGVRALSGATHPVLPDRIETGSYAVAAAITGGELLLENGRIELLGKVANAFAKVGVRFSQEKTGLRVRAPAGRPKPLTITTKPFPGFATDMQAQFMALLALSSGTSRITETIFENRFMHVPELRRMGADIETDGPKAVIRGVKRLKGAPVMATDLRASMCLVLAGLAAEGETVLSRVYHLDRGYEHLEKKLNALGADIRRVRA